MMAFVNPSTSARSAAAGIRRGFTLVELMVVLLVVGVLLGIAYPSFAEQMRKSRRADAIAALTAVQQAQERWRANNPAYAPFNTAAADLSANGLIVPNESPSDYYTLTIEGLSPTTYTLLAKAREKRSQANDSHCTTIGIRANAGNLIYGSGAGSINWQADNPDAGNCWSR